MKLQTPKPHVPFPPRRSNRPHDGGDAFDTFEGWRKRGRGVRKGAEPLQRRIPHEPAIFPFSETYRMKPAASPA